MLRLIYVVAVSLPFVVYYISKARYIERHGEKFSEERRYRMARKCISIMMHNGGIKTESRGQELLPAEGGYVMYSNHQGKYDALGIVDMHERPCSIVMDEARSHVMLTAQFLDLLESKRLILDDMRQGLKIMKEITREIREDHKNFLIFPEGGYTDNHNMVCEFKGGSFRCAQKAEAPIVPVAIINSWKVFGAGGLGAVETEVHFLPPLYYEEYREMNTNEIAATVRDRIQQAILDNLSGEDLETLQRQLSERGNA